jgi:hypothetical protein
VRRRAPYEELKRRISSLTVGQWRSRRLSVLGNIKMDLGEIGWGSVDWIVLAQDRDQCRALVNAVMNVWVP